MATKTMILLETALQSFPTPTLNGSGYKGISQPTRSSQPFAIKSVAPPAIKILPRKKREYHPFRYGYKLRVGIETPAQGYLSSTAGQFSVASVM